MVKAVRTIPHAFTNLGNLHYRCRDGYTRKEYRIEFLGGNKYRCECTSFRTLGTCSHGEQLVREHFENRRTLEQIWRDN